MKEKSKDTITRIEETASNFVFLLVYSAFQIILECILWLSLQHLNKIQLLIIVGFEALLSIVLLAVLVHMRKKKNKRIEHIENELEIERENNEISLDKLSVKLLLLIKNGNDQEHDAVTKNFLFKALTVGNSDIDVCLSKLERLDLVVSPHDFSPISKSHGYQPTKKGVDFINFIITSDGFNQT